MTESPQDRLLTLTGQIVAAYAGNNNVAADALPQVINAVYQSLRNVNQPAAAAAQENRKPAVSPRRSVFPEYIICLEDGKRFKMLKRHLKTTYNITPEQYRMRWNLAADYPMTAPNYAKQRSKLAKQSGLGRKPVARIVRDKAA